MPIFGGRSERCLSTTHPDLVRVHRRAILSFDYMIIQSDRTQAEQEADFAKGATNAHWLQSPHDFNPSFATDCAPVPLHWNDINAFGLMAAAIKQAAHELNIPISWGGDWKVIPGRKVNKDYPHIELANWKELAKALVKPTQVLTS